ncbi:MAG: phosphotransferase [Clostridia bacterium]|nr:phosphotransferase [Clostridia bacterium]
MTIQEICGSFDIVGRYISCSELTTGNINCTYHVKYVRDGEGKDYIVQRINKNVFKEPEKVMENIVCVTDYVRQNIIKKGLSTKRFVLRAFLSKKDGKPYVIDEQGDYWRCYRYIKNSTTFDQTDDLKVIERVGVAFGRFQDCLDGFDACKLFIPIKDFHNTPKRYLDFYNAVTENVCGRVKEVKCEIERINEYKDEACKLQSYLDQGKLPLRVTHNDTKSNNVSFDMETLEPMAVLDLDTVMPGALAYDFGDAIRFIANTELEDCPDFEKVSLDINKYEAFAKGFLAEVKHSITETEIETLNIGVFTMTVELAMRFLTDYLRGDVYFKTKYPGHNLDRARNQLVLANDVMAKMERLEKIIRKYV